MKLIFYSSADNPALWSQALNRLMPDLDVYVWPDVPDKEAIDAALVWKPPQGLLKQFSHLKLIASLGMGVDHILQDPELPADVPVARLIDDNIIAQMGEYVCHAALHYHRRMEEYERFQRERRWHPLPPPDTAQRRVGVLGLGAIGSHTARLLTAVGFAVIGWSRTPKSLDAVQCFQGDQELAPFLQRSHILVCLLPLTEATRGIINAATLATLPRGAYVINCARGGHVIEEDLLAALAEGHIAGATLDTFRQEPLPVDHPFWTHPKVRVTPHSAGITIPQQAAPQVVENLRRVQAGEPLLNLVEREKGY
jgi:glyoxylate/hydroxypyruvate reductase A